MKIVNNNELRDFFKRCEYNIVHNNVLYTKEFEGIAITNETESILMDIMKSYHPSYNSVYVNTDELMDNPYLKNINLLNINRKDINIETVTIPKAVTTRISWLYPDLKQELNDYMLYQAYKKDIKIPVLKQGDTVWMSPTKAEIESMEKEIDKAKGKVLKFGLGIGYYPYMCSLKDNVESITVIELDTNIIEVFKQHILPQFENGNKINIIQGNLYDYYREDFINQFDYVYVDTWEDNDTGLEIITKLLEMNKTFIPTIDYWIEFSCYMPIRMLMVIYFKSICEHTYSEKLCDMKEYDRIVMRKMHRYFRNKEIIVESQEVLKDFLYDNKVYREILSIRL